MHASACVCVQRNEVHAILMSKVLATVQSTVRGTLIATCTRGNHTELTNTEELAMPEKQTVQRAQRDKREGKAPTTQAGEFIREEMEHIRKGKHGARSSKQAIAIGLSKARRAGVDLPRPQKGAVSEKTRKSAAHDYERGHGAPSRPASTTQRSRAIAQALKREGHSAASHQALAKQAHSAASKRTPAQRSAAARRAARTKGPAERSAAARKAAHTREVRAGA
jgi:hypothetical protein